MAEEQKEDQELLLLPPLVRGVFDLLPTKRLGVPSLDLVWRGGARPATRIETIMKPLSGGSIIVIFNFSEVGNFWEIVYVGAFTNKVPVMYIGLDPWRVVGEAWRLLPPKSKR